MSAFVLAGWPERAASFTFFVRRWPRSARAPPPLPRRLHPGRPQSAAENRPPMVQHSTPATPIWFVYARFINTIRSGASLQMQWPPLFLWGRCPQTPERGSPPFTPATGGGWLPAPKGTGVLLYRGRHFKRQAVVFAIANLHRQAWPLDVVAAWTLSFF